MSPVMTVRVACPERLREPVLAFLSSQADLVTLTVSECLEPPGATITADIPREGANSIIDGLMDLDVHEFGTIQLAPVPAWISRRAMAAEAAAPGDGADAVVWSEVIHRCYEETRLNWTYVSFMILATLLAGIAVITDSSILLIGAMVLGPEFVPVAALGVALVRRRGNLLRQALSTLLLGFVISIAVVTVVSWLAHQAHLFGAAEVSPDSRPGTSFIFQPDQWSFIIAVIAGSAGVLAMTSARGSGLVGVFISVTTIPASGNIAVALAVGAWHEMWGSAATLLINIVGMAIAGWLTLLVQNFVWRRVRRPSARFPQSRQAPY